MKEFFYHSSEHAPLLHEEASLYESIAREAVKWVGYPSVKHDISRPDLGMDPENGFDCSGFVTFVFKNLNLAVPQSPTLDSVDRFYCNTAFDNYGVSIHYGLHKEGDLIFFSYDGKTPDHMGIVITPETYIDASSFSATGVEIKPIQQKTIELKKYEHEHYLVNPIGFKRPMERRGRYSYPLGSQVFT